MEGVEPFKKLDNTSSLKWCVDIHTKHTFLVLVKSRDPPNVQPFRKVGKDGM